MFVGFTQKFGASRWLSHRILLAGIALFLLSGNLLAGSVNLAWNAVTASNLGGYKLYYGQSSRNYTSSVDVGNQTAYTLSGLQDGATYYFAVTAHDAAGTTESGYSNEVSATVAAAGSVTVDFTASKTSGAAPLVVSFTPAVTPATATITHWLWDFGDPTIAPATSSNATVSYGQPGTYTVKLTATDSSGKSVSTTKTNLITVLAPPVASAPPSGSGNTGAGTSGSTAAVTTSGNGLVAAYGFEEASGTTVWDQSGNGNHGTITQAVRTTGGRFGNALKFDGVNDWVSVNPSPSLALTKGMTLEAWVRPTVWMNGWVTVIMKDPGGEYGLYANTDRNQPAAGVRIDGYPLVSGVTQLPPYTWTHLAATYDGQYERLYINGVEVSIQQQTAAIPSSNDVLRIGGNSWGEFFQGYIDEVRIYNRPLSQAEIFADSNTGVGN